MVNFRNIITADFVLCRVRWLNVNYFFFFRICCTQNSIRIHETHKNSLTLFTESKRRGGEVAVRSLACDWLGTKRRGGKLHPGWLSIAAAHVSLLVFLVCVSDPPVFPLQFPVQRPLIPLSEYWIVNMKYLCCYRDHQWPRKQWNCSVKLNSIHECVLQYF